MRVKIEQLINKKELLSKPDFITNLRLAENFNKNCVIEKFSGLGVSF